MNCNFLLCISVKVFKKVGKPLTLTQCKLMLAQAPNNFFVICKIFFLDLTTILGFIAEYTMYTMLLTMSWLFSPQS